MGNSTIRYILLASLLMVGMVLYNNWEIERAIPAQPAQQTKTTDAQSQDGKLTSGKTGVEKTGPESISDLDKLEKTEQRKSKTSQTTQSEIEKTDIPETKPISTTSSTEDATQSGKGIGAGTGTEPRLPPERLVHVETDVLQLDIDTLGGDIVQLKLPAYGETQAPNSPGFTLLDFGAKRYYIAQSGLTGNEGPDVRGVGRAQYVTDAQNYTLTPGLNAVVVDLKVKSKTDIPIIKRFVFERGSYLIQVQYLIDNKSQSPYHAYFYGRLKQKADIEKSGSMFGIQTYTGAAVHTPDTPFKKLSFKDIADKGYKADLPGGWAAMVEHYFVSAWIPDPKLTYTYQASTLSPGVYGVEFISPLIDVQPGEQKSIGANLYAGPEEMDVLSKIAPGLELSVDYGILWPICQPIFWLLKQINDIVGNWGFSIIIITILIKLLFYRLSASSYRSMGNMRKLQPRIESLKERYGDDKQKFSQAVMELYRKEKVNPLGGCLPILVQIPVFIALYYVLLGSVDLRHAPFILWITDLSAKDPYYVLPILMGASMLIQQKLSPAPPDPVQAKVMMAMPIVFTVLFLNFPAGLMLYWVVNNLLSIVQQWYITRHIEKSRKDGGK